MVCVIEGTTALLVFCPDEAGAPELLELPEFWTKKKITNTSAAMPTTDIIPMANGGKPERR